jgi:hypothetical protein
MLKPLPSWEVEKYAAQKLRTPLVSLAFTCHLGIEYAIQRTLFA